METSELIRATLRLVEYDEIFAAFETDVGSTTEIKHDEETGD